VTSRKEWPQDVKRKALIELMKDTPRQLLAKEIWLASSGAASAFQRQQRYGKQFKFRLQSDC
jgi:PI-3-kinase-related kinase SMG-1